MRHPSPPPSPLSSPSPAPVGGTPSNTGAQLRMGIFTPKMEKRRGALFKNGKNSGGGTRFGRGFTGKIFKNGKSRRGVPVLEGGLWGNLEEREKRRLEPVKTGKNAGGGYPFGRGFTGTIWKKENFILYLWERIRIE